MAESGTWKSPYWFPESPQKRSSCALKGWGSKGLVPSDLFCNCGNPVQRALCSGPGHPKRPPFLHWDCWSGLWIHSFWGNTDAQAIVEALKYTIFLWLSEVCSWFWETPILEEGSQTFQQPLLLLDFPKGDKLFQLTWLILRLFSSLIGVYIELELSVISSSDLLLKYYEMEGGMTNGLHKYFTHTRARTHTQIYTREKV